MAVSATICSVKRIIVALVFLSGLAGIYGYLVTRSENRHRDLIRRGDAAMAGGDLSTAIEAFSGAIALKSDSMIGYLMRGDAYRRRDELEAALRDLRQAAELDPARPGLASCSATSITPGIAIRPLPTTTRRTSSSTRSPRVLYKLALARYRAGQPTPASRRCRRRSPSTTASPKRTICSGFASATRSSPHRRWSRSNRPSSSRRR